VCRSGERYRVDHHLPPHDDEEELAEIREGLERPLPEVSPKHLYDEYGSRLFHEICSLPEYYQTRTERKILSQIADDVVARTGVQELLELGSGTSTKTRVLLDAMSRAGTLKRYLPFDVSEEIVHEVADELIARYEALSVHAIIGDFDNHLPLIPRGEHRLVIFLGGTIGNFPPADARAFLSSVGESMGEGDHLLLGVDLIKDPAILEAAYNDSRGVTVEFNRNALRVLNAKLDADWVPDAFDHRAFFDRSNRWIEMRLVSRQDQSVLARRLKAQYAFPKGSELRTEFSVKYDRPRAEELLDDSGFALEHWYTDEDALFAVLLARRR